MSRAALLQEIEAERDHQQRKWGDAFDDSHTSADWWTIISLHTMGNLLHWKDGEVTNDAALRRGLVKVAALVISWIEALDRR